MKSYEIRAILATEKQMQKRGYEILDKCYSHYIHVVAYDPYEEVIHFIVTTVTEDGSLPNINEIKEYRGDIEMESIFWLEQHDYFDVTVQYDAYDFRVTSEDKALLRWHQNCLG